MHSTFSHQIQVSFWDYEVEKYEFDQDDLDTVDAAEFPDSLALYKIMADNDPKFIERRCEWEASIKIGCS